MRVVALRQAWGAGPGQPVILLPGRLTRWKGAGVLLEALPRLPDGTLAILMRRWW